MKKYSTSYEESQKRLKTLLESTKYTDHAAYYFETAEMNYDGAVFQETNKPNTVLKPNLQWAIECYQRAANFGHDVAQYKYAFILEEQKKNDEAVLYYIMAALQDNKYAYEKLEKLAPFIKTKLSILKTILNEQRLLIDNKFVLSDDKEIYDEHNKKEIFETICAFKSLIMIYGYLCEKDPTEHLQLEKRQDFAAILRILNNNAGGDIKIRLQEHEAATNTRFQAKNYGVKLFPIYGYQTYLDLRINNLNVLKNTTPATLKTVSSAVFADIRMDVLKHSVTAANIIEAPEDATISSPSAP